MTTPPPHPKPTGANDAGAPPPDAGVGPAFWDELCHELRTGLNAINAGAELLVDGSLGPLNAEARECATVIQSTGRRLAEVSRTLLGLGGASADDGDTRRRAAGFPTFRDPTL